MSERSTDHATFVLERTYGASPTRVFAAWAEPEAKSSWFGVRGDEHSLDFSIGGQERLTVKAPDGCTYTYEALYRDIVSDARIVYVYEMYRDQTRLSVSVATVEFEALAEGTRLVLTEQGVFLDGQDTRAAREEGTKPLLEAVATYLEQQEAHA
jgi:uncharacterized protein YndB with AHSA1/START domain